MVGKTWVASLSSNRAFPVPRCRGLRRGNLHKLGRAGVEQLSRSMRALGFRETLGGASKKMRDRFRREDEET